MLVDRAGLSTALRSVAVSARAAPADVLALDLVWLDRAVWRWLDGLPA